MVTQILLSNYMHFKAPNMATPISIPNLTRKNIVLQEKHCYLRCVYFAQVFFDFLTLNNSADLSFNSFSTLSYAWFMSFSKIAPIIELYLGTMVDSM